MNLVSNNLNRQVTAPRTGKGPDHNSALVHRCLHQLHSLTLIRQLNPLTLAIQQHRGASSALLEGNTSFSNRTEQLQEEIENRFRAIEIILGEYPQLVPDDSLRTIRSEWDSLAPYWAENSFFDNFELHSHVIDQLMKLIWQVAQHADSFCIIQSAEANLPEAVREGEAAATVKFIKKHTDHRELVQVILNDIPDLIETVAKIRGFATHATVTGYCDDTHQARLVYWLQSANYRKEILRKRVLAIHHYTQQGMTLLADMQLHDHKLVQLVDLVNREIMGRDRVEVESHQLFDFATGIINIYSSVIDQGLALLRNSTDETLSKLPPDTVRL